MTVYRTVGHMPILLLLLAISLPAGLFCSVAAVYLTLHFSRVTLIRKLQSTTDLNHFHARDLPCSRVKSLGDPISDHWGDSAVPYSFIYRFAWVLKQWLVILIPHIDVHIIGIRELSSPLTSPPIDQSTSGLYKPHTGQRMNHASAILATPALMVTGHFGPKTLRYQDTSAPVPKSPEDTSALVPKCPDSSAPSHFGTKTFRH